MSDQSSESSGEWVVLGENDGDLSSENIEQSLNLELNYNAVCNAVSDSIRSSLSSEELEWQYEQFEEYTSPYSPSYIEVLDPKEFDVKCTEDLNVSQVEDDNISKCTSLNGYEDIDLESIPKIRCYKHSRNDNLNFILNLMLAIVVSSAIGLGIGHFLGWSHKCYTKVTKLSKAASSGNLPDIITTKEDIQVIIDETEKQVMLPEFFYDNLSDSLPCLNSKDESIATHLRIPYIPLNNSFVPDAVLPEASIFMTSDIVELKKQDINEFPHPSFSHISDVSRINWNKISSNKILVKNEFSGSNVLIPVNEGNLFIKDRTKHTKFELPNEFYIKDKGSFKEFKGFHDSEETFLSNKNNLFHTDEVNSDEFELLKQFYIKDTDFQGENNLTNQLRHDLNQVIESLSTIVFRHLTEFDEKYFTSVGDSKRIMTLYKSFQNAINTKITLIENFVASSEYKTHHKFSLRHLRKMVYSLVDSIDYLMKVSFKPLSNENKKINIQKFSNNISKVIFNFNKKWEKNNRLWAEALEKAKFRELKENSFKKENKHWKQKVQFEKNNYRNEKFRRYAMKS